MSWLFLAVSLIGLWFTANALWPARRIQLVGPSFFAAWLTGELAGFHLAWQVVATVMFIALGALSGAAGFVGLAVTALSWFGLVWIIVVASRSSHTLERALRDALGADYRDRIAPGRLAHLGPKGPWRKLFFPFWLREPGVERIRNLRYAEGARERHLLDVYRPRAGADRAPVLLQIHGGGWVIGDKSQQGLPLMNELAAAGWVCVANNYRLSPKATFPDHLVDCKRALAWIREHIAYYGGDPDFVVVTGGSAGGHLAALMGLTPNDPEYQPGFESVDTSVAACIPFYGVYDLVDTFQDPDGTPTDMRLATWLMGASIADDQARFERASPVYRVHAEAPPFFVIHGDHDNLVPVDQARAFVKALRDTSRHPVAYAEIAGGSHAFDVFHSVRADNTVNAAHRFAAWAYAVSSETPAATPPEAETPARIDPPAGVNATMGGVDAAAGGGS
ncbi:MAG TPA: alpha/beta hydrolase [Acidimicrobiia bacterium]|nr:alpha/beta hydrolase [Acidimicrobiia bacterium]